MKKRWILIPVAVGLLALVVTGGAIFAQGNNHPGPGGSGPGLASRVAEILGLEESVVQSAFTQAIRERQDAHLQSRLDHLVSNERITADDAGAVFQWFQDRPDAAVHLPGVFFRREEALQRRLARMVEAGVITQEQADQVMTWHQDRPEVLPTHPHGPRGRGHGSHGGLGRGDNGAN